MQTSGHGFYRHYSYAIISWSKVPNVLNGDNQFGKETQFVLRKCTSVLPSLLEVPRINCFTMSTYHYAFGPKDEWVENLVFDQLSSQP
jgi:hypothetical protein